MLLVALAIILNYCGRGVVRRAAQPQDALGLCRVAIDTGKLVVLLVVVSARLHHVSQLVGLCHRGAYHVAIVAERRRIAPLTDGVGLLHGIERDVLLARRDNQRLTDASQFKLHRQQQRVLAAKRPDHVARVKRAICQVTYHVHLILRTEISIPGFGGRRRGQFAARGWA